jgi:hypothetical protein
MEKNCNACGSTRFRRSHFRIADVPMLLILCLPVRCLECHERTYASVLWVVTHRRKRAHRRHAPRDAAPR